MATRRKTPAKRVSREEQTGQLLQGTTFQVPGHSGSASSPDGSNLSGLKAQGPEANDVFMAETPWGRVDVAAMWRLHISDSRDMLDLRRENTRLRELAGQKPDVQIDPVKTNSHEVRESQDE
jgi:hypothetical protein